MCGTHLQKMAAGRVLRQPLHVFCRNALQWRPLLFSVSCIPFLACLCSEQPGHQFFQHLPGQTKTTQVRSKLIAVVLQNCMTASFRQRSEGFIVAL